MIYLLGIANLQNNSYKNLEKANATKVGVCFVDTKSEGMDNEKVLQGLREKDVDKQIWDHTIEVFSSTS